MSLWKSISSNFMLNGKVSCKNNWRSKKNEVAFVLPFFLSRIKKYVKYKLQNNYHIILICFACFIVLPTKLYSFDLKIEWK
jgi:hypothetical protein